MEQEKLNQLFIAIKKDDCKSFSSIMLSNSDLNISFGRFPILSLLHLYGSYSILAKYEKYLCKIHEYQKVFEPYDIYSDFKKKAKKSLRLFLNSEEFVYPILMLAILDERDELQNNYKIYYKNAKINEILAKIYKINCNISLIQENEEIVLPKKKMNFANRISIFAVMIVFVLFSVFSLVSVIVIKTTNGIGTKSAPILVSSEQELLKAIKTDRCYKLTQDISIGEDFLTKDFGGVIDGDGHTITLSERVTGLFETVSGSLCNLKISVTITNKNISQNFAILAQKNTGIIENVQILGEISISSYSNEESYISGMVVDNSGTITDSEISLNAVILNKESSDTFFTGFAGINNGKIENVKTKSCKFETDTTDVSGIATTNNGEIVSAINQAEISQSSEKEWHPHSSGIVINNYGTISGCENQAKITAISQISTKTNDSDEFYVFVGGVATQNYGKIEKCENSGTLSGKSQISKIYVGGISALNQATESKSPIVSKSKVTATLSAESLSGEETIGGIVASNSAYIYQIYIINVGTVEGSGFVGKIETDAKTVYAGGVVGENYYGSVKDSYSSANLGCSYDGDRTNVVLAYIIAGARISVNLDMVLNNYYVKTSDITYVITGYVSVGESTLNTTKISSLDELPNGVRL